MGGKIAYCRIWWLKLQPHCSALLKFNYFSYYVFALELEFVMFWVAQIFILAFIIDFEDGDAIHESLGVTDHKDKKKIPLLPVATENA